MRGQFIDLHVSPRVEASLLRHLGWRAVAIASLTLSEARESPRGLIEGVEAFRRLDVKGFPSRSLMARARRLVEVVAVEPQGIGQARLAARSGLADLISLPAAPGCFDEGVASLMESTGTVLELNLLPLIKSRCSPSLLSQYRKWYRVAKAQGVEVVFSTGASTSLEARSPRDLAALASMITLSVDEARDALSKRPQALLEEGKRRLSEGYVMPGVRVV